MSERVVREAGCWRASACRTTDAAGRTAPAGELKPPTSLAPSQTQTSTGGRPAGSSASQSRPPLSRSADRSDCPGGGPYAGGVSRRPGKVPLGQPGRSLTLLTALELASALRATVQMLAAEIARPTLESGRGVRGATQDLSSASLTH